MSVKTYQGKKFTARIIELDYGSPKKPWVVMKSDDAGIWAIQSFEDKDKADSFAATMNAGEDERCRLVNSNRKDGRTEIPRELFDDYYVISYKDAC